MVNAAEPGIQAAILQKKKPDPPKPPPPPPPTTNDDADAAAKAARDGVRKNSGTVADPSTNKNNPGGPMRNPRGNNPPPRKPNVMHTCEGGFHADPVADYAREKGRFNVRLAGEDLAPVQEVAIRVNGVDQTLMNRVSQGQFTFGFTFKGIAGKTLITFVGKDAQGADFCEYPITVTSKGPRQ